MKSIKGAIVVLVIVAALITLGSIFVVTSVTPPVIAPAPKKETSVTVKNIVRKKETVVAPQEQVQKSTDQTQTIVYKVPFTPQAPYADWDDPRQQDGCEEASALMAMRWVTGKKLSRREALNEIIAISDFQQKQYGYFQDTSARDTIERIFKGYFKYTNVALRENIGPQDIIEALQNDQLVVLPVHGQKLGNPYFTPPGPITHVLVVIGYDPKTDEFITNDPGTKRGAGFRYKASVIDRAIQDYPSGFHESATGVKRNMIVVSRQAI